MIKICSPQLGISPVSSLGGETYDYQTLKGFTQRQCQVIVYLPKGRSFDKNLKNFQVYFAPIKHIVPPVIYSFICLPFLFRTYKKTKFDILRIHSPRFLGIAGLLFHYFYPKVPILVSAVTVDSERIYYWIEKKTYDSASAIIVQSEYMKSLLVRKYKTDPQKIAVTYGGMDIDNQTFTILPKQAKLLNKSDKVMLFMGSLIARKNPLFALEIFYKILTTQPNLKFVVIGQGDQKKEMMRKVDQWGIEKKVIFINSAHNEERAYWLNRMDIFIFPSLNEGFGLVVTLAMSYGKVVVSSDKAAFKEIIDNGKDGFTLTLNNRKIWQSTILRLLKSKKLRDKMGKLARQKVEQKFNWDLTYDLNKQVVERLI